MHVIPCGSELHHLLPGCFFCVTRENQAEYSRTASCPCQQPKPLALFLFFCFIYVSKALAAAEEFLVSRRP